MKNVNLPQPFYFPAGEKAVLLLHAYTGSANDVRIVGRMLQQEGYSVYAPNLTGHATPVFEDILDLGSPEKWTADVEQARLFLMEKGHTKIAVFGLSLGGVLATHALESGRYIAGGSFNSPVYALSQSKVPRMFLYYAREAKKKLGHSPAQIEQELQMMQPKLELQLAGIQEFSLKIQQDIGSITVPYFIAQSGKDEMISQESVLKLREALPPDLVDYHFYPDATHVITIGAQREPFEKDLAAFLNQLNWK